MTRFNRLGCAAMVAGLLAAVMVSDTGATARGPAGFGKNVKVILTEESLAALLGSSSDAWKPGVAPKTRGGAEIFAKVAPATVVVRTAIGHGTGILIGGDGFLLTNYHVIAEGMIVDPRRRASVAKVHLGRMNADGSITLAPQPVDALFYAADKTRDLALLRLAEVPAALAPLPSVALADQPPRPGQAIAMLGHPASGMLWTFRSCQVAAVGNSPGDIVDLVVQRLAAAGSDRRELEETLAKIPSRRIVVSSCEANPGDSGGPLVDEAGKLVAVTFAIPAQPERSKFTYHVHLDEVRAFLANRPSGATMLTPDPWELGPRVELIDLVGEGRPQVLAAGTERPEQFLFDLDGDTDPGLLRTTDRSLVAGRKFEAEFALHISKRGTVAFYDTDNDGTFDLILQGKGGGPSADQVYTRGRDGGWDVRAARAGERFVSPDRFVNPMLGRRLAVLIRASGM